MRPSGMIGGPRETRPWWNCEPTLQSERARMETLLLRLVRARSIPITSHPRRVAQARFRIAERTVSRWIQPASKNPDPARRWLAFLRNHRDAIAAMDFFTVPTLRFGVLYCFCDRSRPAQILHLNLTQNPSAPWVALQLRQPGPYDQPQRFLIFDRDAKFNADVVATVEDYGMLPMRTALRSPWQKRHRECWVGSVRRDLLDHVMVVNPGI